MWSSIRLSLRKGSVRRKRIHPSSALIVFLGFELGGITLYLLVPTFTNIPNRGNKIWCNFFLSYVHCSIKGNLPAFSSVRFLIQHILKHHNNAYINFLFCFSPQLRSGSHIFCFPTFKSDLSSPPPIWTSFNYLLEMGLKLNHNLDMTENWGMTWNQILEPNVEP